MLADDDERRVVRRLHLPVRPRYHTHFNHARIGVNGRCDRRPLTRFISAPDNARFYAVAHGGMIVFVGAIAGDRARSLRPGIARDGGAAPLLGVGFLVWLVR